MGGGGVKGGGGGAKGGGAEPSLLDVIAPLCQDEGNAFSDFPLPLRPVSAPRLLPGLVAAAARRSMHDVTLSRSVLFFSEVDCMDSG